MNKELVSIIILSYKNLKYLNETIDSVLTQDYDNMELIIGDDGTIEFDSISCEEYIRKNNRGNIKNITVYKNDINIGTVKNLNKAISLSSGEYIKWMAADDIFYSDTVISQLVTCIKNTNALIVTSNMQFCDEEMNYLGIGDKRRKTRRKIFTLENNNIKLFRKMAVGNYIDAPGVIYTRELIEKYGLFDEEYTLLEDWPTWLRLLRTGCKIEYLDITSVKYRYGIGVSSSKQPNPILIKDQMKCIEKEILPYKKEVGYWLYKNIKYTFIRMYEFNHYTLTRKNMFLAKNLDVIIISQLNKIIRNLIKLSLN